MSTPNLILQHDLFDGASVKLACPGCGRDRFMPLTNVRAYTGRIFKCRHCGARAQVPDIDKEFSRG